jgi:hypothetical protein
MSLRWGSTPRFTDWLTVSRNVTWTWTWSYFWMIFIPLKYYLISLHCPVLHPRRKNSLQPLLWDSSPSHIATDGQSVSKSWCQAPSEAHDQIFITVWQLRSCFCGAPSLTRGWACHLYMLLALASSVFLGSKSLGPRDHILLSGIWDFTFCHLLQLAGSRWRYSTPPPHRVCEILKSNLLYII